MSGGSGSSTGWLREHGWLLDRRRPDVKPTHLLLDGGKARVPDESAGAFLNAYAIAVVRGPPPSVVELRTPVFRLFLDLDVRTAADAPPLRFADVMRALQRRAAAFFATDDPPRAVVCTTEPKVQEDGSTKAGRHVVWTNVWVSAATALTFRAAAVEDLEAALPDACSKSWAQVVDACVFTSNGLRMPFSAKGRAGTSVYLPDHVWVGEDPAGERVGDVQGVSAVRRWVRELSLRAFGVDETAVREGVHVPEAAAGEGLCGTARSLREFEGVLPALEAALPAQFAGSRFTGVIKAESCYLLRSSSRYCGNVGRAHNTCNIYFVLSLKGIRQGCYCRCDTLEGRRYGLCRDYRGETHPVPDEVLAAFFGDGAPPPPPPELRLPSATSTSAASLHQLLSRSRPALKATSRRRAATAAAAAAAATVGAGLVVPRVKR